MSDLIWRMGMPHVRERLSWTGVNPQPDKLDFDNYMYNGDLLRERGILISGLVHDCPPWAAKLQKLPSDLNAVFTFCSKTAAAFGNRMGDWEFWNEQDISFAPEPVWDYAPALKAAYLGLKAGHAAAGRRVRRAGLREDVLAPRRGRDVSLHRHVRHAL